MRRCGTCRSYIACKDRKGRELGHGECRKKKQYRVYPSVMVKACDPGCRVWNERGLKHA